MVSRLKHENVVEMLSYCVEGNLRILAYEFATMGSLHDVLHGMAAPPLSLDLYGPLTYISLQNHLLTYRPL